MLRAEGYMPEQPRWPVTDIPLVLKGAHNFRVWLLTLRHTGTHYLFRHLERLGFFQGQFDHQKRVLKNNLYAPYFLHSHIESMPILEFVCDEPAIVTMRNPRDVYISHLNRYAWLEGAHVSYLLAAYDLYEKVRKKYGAFIFHVDAPDQENEVMELACWLGVEFNYKDVPKNLNHDGRRRSVPQDIPIEIDALATHYGY